MAAPFPPDPAPGNDPSAAQPAPGWYPDPTGQVRWWDGTAWGAASTPATVPGVPAAPDPTMAMLCHLLGIFTGFLGPLIIYLTTAKQDPFVRHHAAESLNFQISVAIASVVSGVLMCFLIGFVLLPIVIVGALIFEIQGCLAANRGEWWRYPLNIRMVSGAVG